jgi:hypothetical protein
MGAFPLSDGRLVVLGGGDPVLALFDAEGDFLRGMGGAGDGPGDTIMAHDPMGRALHRYDPEGEPAGSLRLDAPSRVTPLLAVSEDEILLRVVDEFDVPHLHLHHLDRELP